MFPRQFCLTSAEGLPWAEGTLGYHVAWPSGDQVEEGLEGVTGDREATECDVRGLMLEEGESQQPWLILRVSSFLGPLS
jgi:hypothetical protein